MSGAAVAALSKSEPEYIFVDLDGTLVLTDTFVLTLLGALRRRPLSFPALVLTAIRKGRAGCKRLAAALARLDVPGLPYNEDLVAYLRVQRAAGRQIILATGADSSVARGVAHHLGIFHEVIGSQGGRNVVGEEKLRAIRERIGDLPFAYAGNSRADLKV